MRSAIILLGVIFALIAIVYWVVPAGSLPDFVPGFEAGGTRIHIKHGAVAAVIALVLFGFAWYRRR